MGKINDMEVLLRKFFDDQFEPPFPPAEREAMIGAFGLYWNGRIPVGGLIPAINAALVKAGSDKRVGTLHSFAMFLYEDDVS